MQLTELFKISSIKLFIFRRWNDHIKSVHSAGSTVALLHDGLRVGNGESFNETESIVLKKVVVLVVLHGNNAGLHD